MIYLFESEKTMQNDFQLLHAKLPVMDRTEEKNTGLRYLFFLFLYEYIFGIWIHTFNDWPPSYPRLCWNAVSLWFLDSVWLFLQKLSHLRQLLGPIGLCTDNLSCADLVPRVISRPSLSSSVESHEHSWALRVSQSKPNSWRFCLLSQCVSLSVCHSLSLIL